MSPSKKHRQVVIFALKQHFLTSCEDVSRGFLHTRVTMKEKQRKKQPDVLFRMSLVVLLTLMVTGLGGRQEA